MDLTRVTHRPLPAPVRTALCDTVSRVVVARAQVECARGCGELGVTHARTGHQHEHQTRRVLGPHIELHAVVNYGVMNES